ncbi:hypothetical protein L6R52_17595 [Myxococcota bacterium]|nr:hypothetical protein [Myxococcota bacterium]
MDRRTFLRRTLVAGAVASAGVAYLGLRSGTSLPAPRGPLFVLDAPSFGVLALFAERILAFPGSDPLTVAHAIDANLRFVSPEAQADTRLILAVLENGLSGVLTRGSATLFSELTPEGRDAAIERWGTSSIAMLRGATNSLRKLCIGNHYAPLAASKELGYPGPQLAKPEPPPITARGPLSSMPWQPLPVAPAPAPEPAKPTEEVK